MKQRTKEFMKWFFHVDWADLTNYIALALSALLLWWGLKTIINVISTSITG